MKLTATLILLALASLSFCQSAGPAAKAGAPTVAPQAKHKGISRAEREKLRDEVLVEMKLSTEKTVKIKDLDTELLSKQKAARKEDKGLPAEDKKKAAKELHEWYVGKMKEILGEADYKTFNKALHEKIKAAQLAAETAKP